MITQEGIAIVKEFEGLRLVAYKDPGSKNKLPWTIGYGHTGLMSGAKVQPGDQITKEQAEAFLKDDLEATVLLIQKYVKVPLNENQYNALASFVFNVGEKLFKKSSVLKYINQGRMAEVPGRLALYRMNDGEVMPGLVRRRAHEGELWMKPVASTTRQVNAQIKEEIKQTSGVQAQPASTNKPWDWGVAGMFITGLAGLTDEVKKIIGDLTSAIGVSPLVVLVVVAAGFGAWTLYNKWKSR